MEKRAFLVAQVMVALLVIVSLRAAYWQLWKGQTLQPVALDPVRAAREYARLRGDPTPAPATGAVDAGQQSSLAELPQPVIQRTVQMLSLVKRGTIYDRAGNVLAFDQGLPGDYKRVYTDPTLAHVVGYTTALRTGVSGLESTYNNSLLGYDRPDTEIDRMLHRPYQGSDLELTIVPEIQRTAVEILNGRPGAVVVLDGQSGAVLAMTSAPTFDPNRLMEDGYIPSLGQGALLNRATQGRYTPGSTWKTVTLIAALDTGMAKPDTIFNFGEPRIDQNGKKYYVYEVDGGIIPDRNHEQAQLDLTMSYAYSANAAFAKLGNDMAPDVMIDYASRLGFSTEDYPRHFPLELPVAESQLANNIDDIRTNNLLRASTGFGQGELLATPINMAMVVESILNEGSIPVPYLVQSIRDPQGNVLQNKPNNHVVRRVMRAETARDAKKIMTAMLSFYGGPEQFTGQPGVTVGMKTGTAQVGGDLEPHAWNIGYVERGTQSAVIVIFLENAGGSRITIEPFQTLSRSILMSYFRDPGQP